MTRPTKRTRTTKTSRGRVRWTRTMSPVALVHGETLRIVASWEATDTWEALAYAFPSGALVAKAGPFTTCEEAQRVAIALADAHVAVGRDGVGKTVR